MTQSNIERQEPSGALDEHGLYVHIAAQAAISTYRELGAIGQYPMYLIGLALPEHRGGPALITLLTLANGGVLGAAARTIRQSVTDLLPYDVQHAIDTDELKAFRTHFYDTLGGFAPWRGESSPTAIAEELLANATLALTLASEVGPHDHGPPDHFPSDWTDAVYYSITAIGCTVDGFAPGPDTIDALDLPDSLKRAMLLAPVPGLDWFTPLSEAAATQLSPQIEPILVEGWSVRLHSPRASLALLRTVSELVANELLAKPGQLARAIARLEQQWQAETPAATPAERRVSAWRSTVLACLDTVRDLGRRIHADAEAIKTEDVEMAHEATRRLLETVLNKSRLDTYP